MKKYTTIMMSMALMLSLSSCTTVTAILGGAVAYAYKDKIQDTLKDLL